MAGDDARNGEGRARSDIFREALDHVLGPILELVRDPTVTEVMVNGPGRVYVERNGAVAAAPNGFASTEALMACVRSIAQYSGKHLDDDTARFDGRLPDGSRVHVVLPPCAREGISLAIRKFTRSPLTLDRLESFGSIDRATRELMSLAVMLDKNVLVSGGTGSGKTQLLNALSAAIPETERVIVIEDTSELRLQQEHVLSLEARAPDRHGRAGVSIRDLLHSSLRLRPDRIIVGECRGGEALDMIQAMSSGHAGSITTVHANSPEGALTRLETLALQSDVDLPLRPLRAQIAAAIDYVVQTQRYRDGSRKVAAIGEVRPLDDAGHYAVRRVMQFEQQRRSADGEVVGAHVQVARPSFWDEMEVAGLGSEATALRSAHDDRSDHMEARLR